MLDPELKARALEVLRNPTPRTPERDEITYAYMTAESLKLSGIETSVEEILELVRLERYELMTPENRKRLREHLDNDVKQTSAKNLLETVQRLSQKDNSEEFQRERSQRIESELRNRVLEIDNQLKSSKGDVNAIQDEQLEHREALKQVRDILKDRNWDPSVIDHNV